MYMPQGVHVRVYLCTPACVSHVLICSFQKMAQGSEKKHVNSCFQRRGKSLSLSLISTLCVYTCIVCVCVCVCEVCYVCIVSCLFDSHKSPCVIYMLRDMDIMEDLHDIRRVSIVHKLYFTHTHPHTGPGYPRSKAQK